MDLMDIQAKVPFSRDVVAAWHERSGAMRRLMPTWQQVQIEREPWPIENGVRGRIRLALPGPFSMAWEMELEQVRPGHGFVDRQIKGPFAEWIHEHGFSDATMDGQPACVLHDKVNYRLPGGFLGKALGGGKIRRDLDAMFKVRHVRLGEDLRRHAEEGPGRSLRIGITGSSGLVGRNLSAFLSTGGHEVIPMVRREARPGTSEVRWDPDQCQADSSGLEGLDAVVHLAAAGIADQRWSKERKALIRSSRVLGTRFLCEVLAELKSPPKVLVSASAIGFYGATDQVVDESAPCGSGLLPEICREWEDATALAKESGIRVVLPRIGVVLSPQGGALAKLLPVTNFGLLGPVGNGRQGMSTIGMDDLIYMIHRAVADESVVGAFNAVGPDPMSQRDFARVLGRVMRRPSFAPLPAFMVKLLFGEMGERLLLDGQFVEPKRMIDAGYRFAQPMVEDVLRLQLGRLASSS